MISKPLDNLNDKLHSAHYSRLSLSLYLDEYWHIQLLKYFGNKWNSPRNYSSLLHRKPQRFWMQIELGCQRQFPLKFMFSTKVSPANECNLKESHVNLLTCLTNAILWVLHQKLAAGYTITLNLFQPNKKTKLEFCVSFLFIHWIQF